MLKPEVQNPAVDFLIAGAQKTGTTALHQLLMEHQNIFLPSRKELHFFDNDYATDWAYPDYTDYENCFLEKKNTQCAGEITPVYSYWPQCMGRISNYNPEIKIILCIRNPVDRAFSHWSMEFARQNESMAFADAIRQGRVRVANAPDSRNGHHRIYSYVERGFYARQISKVLTHFPEDQLLVVTFDNLQRDLNGFLDIICRFLGVPEFINYPRNRKVLPMKPSPDAGRVSKRDRDYLLTLFEEDIKETQNLTGKSLSVWLR